MSPSSSFDQLIASRAPGAEGTRLAALQEAVAHASHYLPDQGPIGVFVHHNTLHAFQHLPFHEAVAQASALFGAEPYLPEGEFRRHLTRGRITGDDLDAALLERAALEGLPERTYGGGLFTSTTVRRLALRHPIEAETAAGLRFRLDEEALATRLASDVTKEAAARVVEGGLAWLRRLAAEDREGELRAALTGEREEGAACAAMALRFGVRPRAGLIEKLLSREPEAAATSALWEVCRQLSARVEQQRQPQQPAPRRVGAEATHAELLARLTGEDVAEMVNRVLIRTTAAYLDEGLAYWPMPAREQGYYRCVRALMALPGPEPEPWQRAARDDLRAQEAASADAAHVALQVLEELGVSVDEFEPYVTRVLLALPGWAGMMSRLERHPEDRPPGAPQASLLDFLAVRLTLERAALRDVAARKLRFNGPLARLAARFGAHGDLPADAAEEAGADHDVAYRLFRLFCLAGVSADAARALPEEEVRALVAELDGFDGIARRRVFQEAYERTHRREVLDAVADNRAHVALARPATPPGLQVVFCIDERLESIRRALEEQGSVETLGVAGFFGLAIDYRGIDDPHPVPFCPVVATPAHEVHERPLDEHSALHDRRLRLRRAWGKLQRNAGVGSRSLVRGVLLSLGLGAVSSFALASRILFPRGTGKLRAMLGAALLPSPATQLEALREEAAPPGARGKHLGFTVEEAAARVASTLENIGLTRGFSPLVVVLGHGSSSQNNPHRSAYDCGACGGRRGGANARLFATMANHPEVRAALRARGIDIPDDTAFIGGLHNTATCAIELYDAALVPEGHRGPLRAAREALARAAMASAHERCRRFEGAPRDLSPRSALRHVEARAESLAEPRPEYGHATNAVCVVGRRALTRGLFLDRRAFLVSYDPTEDPDSAVLERVLAAVGPVGAGINLEYYFSCVDNERYGCGTKLPLNITGHIGVMAGHASDLRTGLPRQMVEIHEPLRLLMVVEATPATLLAIAERQPGLRELIVNRWVQLAAADPQTGAMHVYTERGFVPYEPSRRPLPVVRASTDWYRGRSEHLPPARIARAKRSPAEMVVHAR